MKVRCIVALLLLAACAARAEDVFSNVYFWSRGLATDANGDGVLDAGEGRDSMNRSAFNWKLHNTILYTNAWAHLPYRGTTNFVQAIHLPQTVIVTNEATGAGYGRPCTCEIPNELVRGITTQEAANYTLFIRFCPELTQPHPGYCWLLNFGHSNGNKRGIMIGFNDVKDEEHTWGGGTHPYTNRTAQLTIYYGGRAWAPNTTNMRVNFGNWNDLVLSIDGRQMRAFLSRDGYIKGFENNYDNSSAGVWHTAYLEKTADVGFDLRPNAATDTFILGSESTTSSELVYVSPASANNNYWKAFRGAIQTVALWTNAMNEAQMRAVAAWPRMDRWRLGIENGTATEFAAAEDGAVVDVEGDTWAVPPLAAKGSMTIRFPLDASGDAKMNQVLRVKGAAGGENALLKVAVNGTPCETSKVVQPGRFTRWFVPCGLLRANATNELVVTRVDAGATPFRMDVACLGGSVQLYEDNGSTWENS